MSAPSPQRVPRIILCDDEQLERDALQRIFAQCPAPVAVVGTVGNGLDAIRLAAQLEPDIIFMDIRMPGMSGLDAARQILAERPATQVIILSAYSDFAYAQEALRLGAMDYVLKPAEPEALYGAVSRSLARIEQQETDEQQRLVLERRLAEILPALPNANVVTDDLILVAIDYIRAHYADRLTLEAVAAAVSLNPAYFSRLFAERTGSNFKQYVIWVRMEAAKYLLAETNLQVGQIADDVGYSDANHFSVRFKKTVGRTPNQFRREEGGRRNKVAS